MRRPIALVLAVVAAAASTGIPSAADAEPALTSAGVITFSGQLRLSDDAWPGDPPENAWRVQAPSHSVEVPPYCVASGVFVENVDLLTTCQIDVTGTVGDDALIWDWCDGGPGHALSGSSEPGLDDVVLTEDARYSLDLEVVGTPFHGLQVAGTISNEEGETSSISGSLSVYGPPYFAGCDWDSGFYTFGTLVVSPGLDAP